MDILDEKNFKRIKESKTFVSAYADIAGCTVFRINEADRMANFMFIANEPTPYENNIGEISKQDYEKTRVASITMTYSQAKSFYESLKRQFEAD
ncbi:MAG: hypothetical protein E7B59_20370 [Enterobacteriaceae bacterium]|nr:hypothetical protein [Enterobacteriaceae bacterium]